MEIEIRWISKEYADVTVSVDNHRLDVGVLDKKERQELADKLTGVIGELLED